MPRSALAAPLVPAVLLLVLAGTPTALGATTHEQYVDQVNPICKTAAREAKKIPKQIKPTGDPVADSFLETARFGKLLGRTARRIRAVEPAPEDALLVKSWVDGLFRQKRLIDSFLRAVNRGQEKRAKRLIKRVASAEDQNAANAAQLGLQACTARGGAG